jgi:hypothetical protein
MTIINKGVCREKLSTVKCVLKWKALGIPVLEVNVYTVKYMSMVRNVSSQQSNNCCGICASNTLSVLHYMRYSVFSSYLQDVSGIDSCESFERVL